jgi:hypothetical protein
LAIGLTILAASGDVRGQQEHVGTILGCAPRALVGQTVCVCGKFPDPAPADGFRIDGRPVAVLASNPANVKLQLPPDLAPGPHAITGAGGITGRAVVEVVAPRVWLEVTQLQFTQQTMLHVAAEGTPAQLPVRLTNRDPHVVTLGGGDTQVVPTSGGTPNEIPPREVLAGAYPGQFHIDAEIEVGACPCGITPPTGTGSAGGTVGGPPGGSPPAGGTSAGGGTQPGGVPPPTGGAPTGGSGGPPSSTPPPGGQPPPVGVLLERDDDNWIPAADAQPACAPSGGTPQTSLTARLYQLSGQSWVPTEVKRPITIGFTKRSREKGRALNAPVRSGPEDGPDLYFPAAPNASFRCADDPTGQGFFGSCTTTAEVNLATVVVQAADFGAFGNTDASCPGCVQLVKRADGTIVNKGGHGTGTRFGYTEVDVTVPRDTNGNGIADAATLWERADPAEDADDTPVSRLPGDGLTAYEEYRGFSAAGCHVRTDPTVKDLFLVNQDGFNLDLFRSASGLMVWEIQSPQELRADRVINFNRGQASVVAQHGLVVKNVSAGPGAAGRVTAIGPPRRVNLVIVDRWKGGDEAEVAAHELGHAVGMYHHGEIALEEIDPPAGFAPPNAKPGKKIKLAHVSDQGSGHHACLMRYIPHGDVVADSNAQGGYCAIAQTGAKTLFCSSAAGTGPNANGRCQGNARVGDCKRQLVVSDVW